jgi:flavin reductase (DIM6/NTAB) family NADH-FMN oxidoreductase RutF
MMGAAKQVAAAPERAAPPPPRGRVPMSVDQLEFRSVMGHFATGVTIVTSHDGAGKVGGLTANAVASVSLEPPLVLICVDKKSDSYPLFGASKAFAINILSHQQETLSRRFAKSGGDKFTGIGFRIGVSGSPILNDIIAYLDCQIRNEIDAGDHTIYLGQAVDIAVSSDSDPLLYFRGGYRNLSA